MFTEKISIFVNSCAFLHAMHTTYRSEKLWKKFSLSWLTFNNFLHRTYGALAGIIERLLLVHRLKMKSYTILTAGQNDVLQDCVITSVTQAFREGFSSLRTYGKNWRFLGISGGLKHHDRLTDSGSLSNFVL